MWDSVLLAYADRSRVIAPDYRRLVIRSNGDVLPTLLVDGYVAGVWRPVTDGIEATAFHRLAPEAWDGLEAEARALRALLAGRMRLDAWAAFARSTKPSRSARASVSATRSSGRFSSFRNRTQLLPMSSGLPVAAHPWRNRASAAGSPYTLLRYRLM